MKQIKKLISKHKKSNLIPRQNLKSKSRVINNQCQQFSILLKLIYPIFPFTDERHCHSTGRSETAAESNSAARAFRKVIFSWSKRRRDASSSSRCLGTAARGGAFGSSCSSSDARTTANPEPSANKGLPTLTTNGHQCG